MMQPNPPRRPRLSVFQSWISLTGLVILLGSVFSFLLLLLMDVLSANANPYLGILAYLVAPAFTMLGLGLMVAGLLLERRRLTRRVDGRPAPILHLDFSQPSTRRKLVVFVGGAITFLLLSAVGAYRSYHFSESASFCGRTCHAVMQPEYTTYLRSPHARIACSECHIGPGAQWFVKAKISGLYQVYATAFHKYERPIPTPVRNLRPAQETCEQCHWPEKFSGNLDRVYTHYLSDASNTPFTVRLSLKVGGSDPAHGPVGGIHWHMSVANQVEYIASDEERQVIPWVRVTDRAGKVTEYRTAKFKPQPGKDVIRRMDCVDCHNRPAHIFQSPRDAVDLALSLGQLDPALPNLRKAAIQTLTQAYATEQEAHQKIAADLEAKYRGDARLAATVRKVQEIYSGNFFPLMKTNWKVHPSNLGHMYWPGCFRCHDGEHTSADGQKRLSADCSACHVILAQGRGEQLQKLNAQGHAFDHPGGETGDTKCSECHTGGAD